MNGIIQELKCLLKTKSISLLDQFNLLHINDSIPQISNYAMFLTEQQEPEMIKAKYQEIQELYPQVGFFLGQQLSNFLTKHT